MTNPATTEIVWDAIEKELFAVLGMVTPDQEARTVGIVYIVKDKKIYIGTGLNTWKARHIKNNSKISLTIPIAKRVPFLSWIKIPQATISFSGTAQVIPAEESTPELLQAVFRQFAEDQDFIQANCLIEVKPEGEFITYGVGIPVMKMRQPELARGRAPVN